MKVVLSLVAVFCLGILQGGYAQDVRSDSSDLPAAPQGYILDDTGFFRDHPEKLAEVRKSLKEIEATHGYPVYLAIYYSVFEGNLQSKADELYKAWLGEKGHGMVIVYQRDPVTDGSNPVMSYYLGSELDPKSQETLEDQKMIPRRDTEIMLGNVFRGLKSSPEDQVDYVSEIIFGIERELTNYFKFEPPKWNDSSNLQLMTIFVGAVAAIALLGFVVWRLFVRADAQSGREYYFPEIRMGRRLGAPFGGGWTSEQTFVPSSSQK